MMHVFESLKKSASKFASCYNEMGSLLRNLSTQHQHKTKSLTVVINSLSSEMIIQTPNLPFSSLSLINLWTASRPAVIKSSVAAPRHLNKHVAEDWRWVLWKQGAKWTAFIIQPKCHNLSVHGFNKQSWGGIPRVLEAPQSYCFHATLHTFLR